jgi:4-hydroxybenzoate polyprenyltransferase
MFLLQSSIGVLNDLADAELDRAAKPGKPIPAGYIDRRGALAVFGICFVGGLGLSAVSGPAVFAVALAGLVCGYAYDLRLKGTAWSWLAWTAGVPLLPLFAWLGAGRDVTSALVLLVGLAAIAGAALALANGLADYERDARGGLRSPAVLLGPTVTWRLTAGLEAFVVGIGLASIGAMAAQQAGAALILVAIGVMLVLGGLGLSARARADSRERGWELQAVGLGVLATGWVAAMVASAAL